MERRTIPAYEAVLRTLRILLRGANNFEKIVTDFEPAMRSAFVNMFPDAEVQGCFFHFVRVSSPRIFCTIVTLCLYSYH